MSFDALLNKTATIQTKSVTQSPSGQFVESWANTLTLVKCRIDAMGGQETIAPSMVFEKATHIVFMRNPSSITLDVGTHRIIIDTITYNILLVRRMYEFKDLSHVEILVEIVK